MKTRIVGAIGLLYIVVATVLSQPVKDVIINEVANSGTKKAAYHNGEYVELLVVNPAGVNLGGYFLTDLSSPSSEPKETEGVIQFSDAPGSVFHSHIPCGTYILIWLGDKNTDEDVPSEDTSLTDGNNRLVVFAYNSPRHIIAQKGHIVLTGKDNLVLLKEWKRDAAVEALVWAAASQWEGCKVTELPQEYMDNGKIAWFSPVGNNFRDNTAPSNWKWSENENDATPGRCNKGVNDSALCSGK